MATETKYEILEHPADVGFRAWGATREELFENAAAALLALACDPEALEERDERTVEATGNDLESLLYAWLAEILAVMDAEKMFFRRVRVAALEADRVRGTLHGEPYDKQRHSAGTYIKAVTLHQFRIDQTPEGWRAEVYLDV